MSALSSYYYNNQIKRYIAQFMAIFAGMTVSVGRNENNDPRLIPIPIAYASKDRVVADIKSENVSGNKPIRLPMFSAYLTNIDQAPELRKGVRTERRNTFMRTGGLFPDDLQVNHQVMPVPYRAIMELGMWVSNTDHNFQIVEQLLTLFDPAIQLQTSEETFDWTKLTSVEMLEVGNEENFPAGGDRRLIERTFTFQFTMWISAPTSVKQDFIKDIYLRIGTLSLDSNTTSQSILDAFDATGIEYMNIASSSEFTEEQLHVNDSTDPCE